MTGLSRGLLCYWYREAAAVAAALALACQFDGPRGISESLSGKPIALSYITLARPLTQTRSFAFWRRTLTSLLGLD